MAPIPVIALLFAGCEVELAIVSVSLAKEKQSRQEAVAASATSQQMTWKSKSPKYPFASTHVPSLGLVNTTHLLPTIAVGVAQAMVEWLGWWTTTNA